MKNNRGWLIALSIIVGLVLACGLPMLGVVVLSMTATPSSGSGSVASGTYWEEEFVSGTGIDRVLILEITGVIGAEAGGFGATQLTTEELISQINQAAEDENIKAVVVHVDSPGGGVVASDMIHNELVELREAGKRLIVSMGTTAASGGYYVSAPAERIYANSETFTGSLGVIITLLNYEGALDKLGLQQRVFKSGEFKDIGSPSRELSQEEIDILQSIVDQAYNRFVDVIADGRGIPRAQVLELADGRIYTGQQALDLNLIDELGDMEDAIAGAKELAGLGSDARVVRYNSAPTLTDLLFASAQQGNDPLGLRTVLEQQTPLLEYRMVP
ncbi:MAG: signal peptide peptidase SppA [Chloroflexaceae bacterium]|nr:signal peptide peptidase SppA [Chloroflexaceae bacterium]NJO04268.1 signal peptide peptidase SppA [Chloroflexaceae bacterium]